MRLRMYGVGEDSAAESGTRTAMRDAICPRSQVGCQLANSQPTLEAGQFRGVAAAQPGICAKR